MISCDKCKTNPQVLYTGEDATGERVVISLHDNSGKVLYDNKRHMEDYDDLSVMCINCREELGSEAHDQLSWY